MKVIKNYNNSVNPSTHGCVCETHNHQLEICTSNQKPSYITIKPYLEQWCQIDMQGISVEMSTNISLGKTQQVWYFSPCKGYKITSSCRNGMRKLQSFVLTVQRIVTCTYHLNLPTNISIYGWSYQARHYSAYANWLPCLFRLLAPPFTLQPKLLYPCISFWETNDRRALQQVLCNLRFICYLYCSESFGKY